MAAPIIPVKNAHMPNAKHLDLNVLIPITFATSSFPLMDNNPYPNLDFLIMYATTKVTNEIKNKSIKRSFNPKVGTHLPVVLETTCS